MLSADVRLGPVVQGAGGLVEAGGSWAGRPGRGRSSAAAAGRSRGRCPPRSRRYECPSASARCPRPGRRARPPPRRRPASGGSRGRRCSSRCRRAEPRVLEDDADLPADLLDVERRQLPAVVGDGPLGRRLEPEQQPQQGRLARARRADHGDELAGSDLEVDRSRGPAGRRACTGTRRCPAGWRPARRDRLAAGRRRPRGSASRIGANPLALPRGRRSRRDPLAQADRPPPPPASTRMLNARNSPTLSERRAEDRGGQDGHQRPRSARRRRRAPAGRTSVWKPEALLELLAGTSRPAGERPRLRPGDAEPGDPPEQQEAAGRRSRPGAPRSPRWQPPDAAAGRRAVASGKTADQPGRDQPEPPVQDEQRRPR